MTGLSIVMLIVTGCAQAQVQLEPTTSAPIPATLTLTSLPTPILAPTATPTLSLATFTPASSVISVTEAGQQVAHGFELEVEGSNAQPARLNYLLFLTKDYGLEPQQRWPLILRAGV
jgi:hypothetical protein